VNRQKVVALFDKLMPVAGIIVIMAVLVYGSANVRIVGIEISVVLISVWLLHHTRTNSDRIRKSVVVNYRFISLVEWTFLGLALVSLLYVNNYTRPLIFFVFIAAFYSMLFLENANATKTSTSAFILKLVLGQLILFESFALLYPGFVGVDSYRDMAIANSIVSNAGGLPRDFGGIIWYDFSPVALLLYGILNLILGGPIRTAELTAGFVFPLITMLSIGSIVNQITQNAYATRTSLLILSILPYFWVWATWPIPEVLALSFLSLAIMVCLQSNATKTIIILTIFALMVVFTHGGIAVASIILMLALYLVGRYRLAQYAFAITSMIFLVYSTYIFSNAVKPGIVTFWTFLLASLTPSTYISTSAAQAGGFEIIIETLLTSFWWIVLLAFTWLGFLLVLREDSKYRRIVLLLTLIATISFIAGVLSEVVATQTDTTRYLGLFGYPFMSICASLGLVSLLKKSQARVKIALAMLVLFFIISGVVSPLVSPDLWQNVGQSHYSGASRLKYSTTNAEFASQSFLNKYDTHYYVLSNYLLEGINLTNPQAQFPLSASFTVQQLGYTLDSISGVPHIDLISFRASELGFPNPTPSTSFSAEGRDIVYSNAGSVAVFLFS
jgi:hypothetical protein